MQMFENVIFAGIDPRILVLAPCPFFLLFKLCDHFRVPVFKLVHQIGEHDGIGDFFEFTDEDIAHGEGNLRQQSAADGGAAGKSDDDDTQIPGMADFV